MKNNKQRTALWLASERGDSQIVGLLLRNEANSNLRDKQGWNALRAAVYACVSSKMEKIENYKNVKKNRFSTFYLELRYGRNASHRGCEHPIRMQGGNFGLTFSSVLRFPGANQPAFNGLQREPQCKR